MVAILFSYFSDEMHSFLPHPFSLFSHTHNLISFKFPLSAKISPFLSDIFLTDTFSFIPTNREAVGPTSHLKVTYTECNVPKISRYVKLRKLTTTLKKTKI